MHDHQSLHGDRRILGQARIHLPIVIEATSVRALIRVP